MANISLVTADKVFIVESIEQMTLPAAEAITAGAPVRIDTSTGKFTNANASSSGEARVYGIATQTVAAGFGLTAIAQGVMGGWDFGSRDYDATMYLSDTDGRIADANGTVNTPVGQIVPAHAQKLGSNPDRLLRVKL